jgi:hypothetical protein
MLATRHRGTRLGLESLEARDNPSVHVAHVTAKDSHAPRAADESLSAV